jgi:hypothetical protein
MSQWQPIESAPTDNTMVLVFMPKPRLDKHYIRTGRCGITGNGRKMWVIGGFFQSDVGTPTHWMPLPEPPE